MLFLKIGDKGMKIISIFAALKTIFIKNNYGH